MVYLPQTKVLFLGPKQGGLMDDYLERGADALERLAMLFLNAAEELLFLADLLRELIG